MKKILFMAIALASTLPGLNSCSRCSNGETEQGISQDSAAGGTLQSASRTQSTDMSNDNDQNLHGYRYAYDKSSEYEDGIMEGMPDYLAIPAHLEAMEEEILTHKCYVVSYNHSTRLANWVAWHLTSAHAQGDVERPERAFNDDPQVEGCTHYWEYKSSHAYDRGHMCPAGDNRWDEVAMLESFYMTNILPQHRSLNGGIWNDIEQQCREWAKSEGDIYIVSGPIFFENRHGEQKTLGVNKIPIPDAFFKVVMSNHGKGKGIGFVCENRNCGGYIDEYTLSIDDVEAITGIDFFPALPDDMEERIEGEIGKFPLI